MMKLVVITIVEKDGIQTVCGAENVLIKVVQNARQKKCKGGR
jgi:hypothetical protein